MKILYVTTIGMTMSFFKELIKKLLGEGHTVDIMCNEALSQISECYREWECEIYHHDCSRSPASMGNLKAILQIRKLVRKKKYDIVHCHTPIAAMCTRLACIGARKRGTKVFYTAHGFHFYKGAPLKNWLLYYPIEKICSYFTDVLITINQEDYQLAKKKMRALEVKHVPGVGVDVNKFQDAQVNRKQKRAELGLPEDATLLLSVGELNKNKNHQVIIRAMAQIMDPKLHYAIAGMGHEENNLKQLALRMNVSDRVHFLGYRTDIAELCKTADIFCFPSIREGLGLAAVEAMAVGLPVIAADNRGTREYMQHGETGFVCRYNDAAAFAGAINKLHNDFPLKQKIGMANQEKSGHYAVENIIKKMRDLYQC